MYRSLSAKLFTLQILPGTPLCPRRTKASASWEKDTVPSCGGGHSILEAGGPDTTSIDLHLLATGEAGLAQCVPHEQHLIWQKAVHQQQLPVEAGIKGRQPCRGGPNAGRADTTVRGRLQTLLLQAHAQEHVIDGEEVQGAGGPAQGSSREAGQQEATTPAVGWVGLFLCHNVWHIVFAPGDPDGAHVVDQVPHKEVVVRVVALQVGDHVVCVCKDVVVPVEYEADVGAPSLLPLQEEHLQEGGQGMWAQGLRRSALGLRWPPQPS